MGPFSLKWKITNRGLRGLIVGGLTALFFYGLLHAFSWIFKGSTVLPYVFSYLAAAGAHYLMVFTWVFSQRIARKFQLSIYILSIATNFVGGISGVLIVERFFGFSGPTTSLIVSAFVSLVSATLLQIGNLDLRWNRKLPQI